METTQTQEQAELKIINVQLPLGLNTCKSPSFANTVNEVNISAVKSQEHISILLGYYSHYGTEQTGLHELSLKLVLEQYVTQTQYRFLTAYNQYRQPTVTASEQCCGNVYNIATGHQ